MDPDVVTKPVFKETPNETHHRPVEFRAAVLGLNGAETSAEAAARITVPVELLVQWDDERVPRAASQALFDAFTSAQKTLHANPGRHAEIPMFELDSSLRFFTRHLS